MCDDILTVLQIESHDHAKVMSRRDEEIQDTRIRETVLRHAGCLGMLVERLSKYDQVTMPESAQCVWSTFLLGPKTDTSTLRDLITSIKTNIQDTKMALIDIENDGENSSYSDYSDSDTVSSDDEDKAKSHANGTGTQGIRGKQRRGRGGQRGRRRRRRRGRRTLVRRQTPAAALTHGGAV